MCPNIGSGTSSDSAFLHRFGYIDREQEKDPQGQVFWFLAHIFSLFFTIMLEPHEFPFLTCVLVLLDWLRFL